MFLELGSIFRVETNIDALLSVDFFSVLAEILSELETGKLTILLLIFISDLVNTFSL